MEIEDMDLMNSKSNHPLDLMIVPKAPYKSSEGNHIQLISKEDRVVEAPHIDFIFKNQPLIFENCNLLVKRQQLKHLKVKLYIRAKCRHQKKQHLQSTSKWRKRSNQACKTYTENEYQQENREIV
eukprot:TRINITY_DN7459_c2_g1_i1.p2 TRINITY_DN7459_c2_g1~~TRINITY_DN7459_c2_g1_i1.p2  ORF type:complete len:125 (-),score=20.30 TRINITY_DN7459_c2_g1_i1:331-705(-)